MAIQQSKVVLLSIEDALSIDMVQLEPTYHCWHDLSWANRIDPEIALIKDPGGLPLGLSGTRRYRQKRQASGYPIIPVPNRNRYGEDKPQGQPSICHIRIPSGLVKIYKGRGSHIPPEQNTYSRSVQRWRNQNRFPTINPGITKATKKTNGTATNHFVVLVKLSL